MATPLPPLHAVVPAAGLVWADDPPGPPAAPRPLLENSEFLVACGLMALVLFGGAYVLSYFDRRRKREEAAFSDTASQMESYRELYEAGEITESEYQRLRSRVAGRMKKEVGLADGPAGAPPKPPPPDAAASGPS